MPYLTTDRLTLFGTECGRQTKELVSEKCRRFDLKKKKLQRTHTREKSSVLDSASTYSNPQQFVKVSFYINIMEFVFSSLTYM